MSDGSSAQKPPLQPSAETPTGRMLSSTREEFVVLEAGVQVRFPDGSWHTAGEGTTYGVTTTIDCSEDDDV